MIITYPNYLDQTQTIGLVPILTYHSMPIVYAEPRQRFTVLSRTKEFTVNKRQKEFNVIGRTKEFTVI